MKSIDREILRLSLPSILANITIPLVGMVDTAVAGHLPAGTVSDAAGALVEVGSATYIGAIAIGSMLFNLLYWCFGFLRTGTGGVTAQAFGAGDMREAGRIFCRGTVLALSMALLMILSGHPFCSLSMRMVSLTPSVEALACQYFFIRIWAAPATLTLMTFSGWFVGMQDTISSMWKDLVVNVVNVVASVVLALGVGSWKGIGFSGIALGTVIAQYSGLLYCILRTRFKYGSSVFTQLRRGDLRKSLSGESLRSFSRINLDLFGRSVGFILIYIGYTALAATLGDMMLACSSIMMQLLMLFSYFTDGFAYAGEAMVGRSIGERNLLKLRETVRRVFLWSFGVVILFIILYEGAGVPMLRLLTDDLEVVDACRIFLPWLILMPPLGCAAFTWDGVFLGAASSRPLCISMLGAAVCFFAVWYFPSISALFSGASSGLFQGAGDAPLREEAGLHLLLAAYFAHLLFRTVYLSVKYRHSVLDRVR